MSILGNLAQGFIGSQAEGKAERQRLAGIEEAKGFQTRGYEEGKGYYNPFLETGMGANKLLAARLGLGQDTSAPGFGDFTRNFSMADYQADPGYAFRLKEGLKAAEGSAAARGGLLSGATTRGVQRRAQDLASQEYGNAYQRYMGQMQNRYNMLAEQQGVGFRAGGELANLGSAYAANMGNLVTGAGNVRAQSTLNKAGAWSNALSRSEQEANDMAKNILGMG